MAKNALVPVHVVSAFKECFVGREVIRTIDEFFGDLEFDYSADAFASEQAAGHGQRRSTAAGYIGPLDLSDPRDCDRLTRAITFKLAEWERTADPNFTQDLDRLKRTLDFAGFTWDGRSLIRRAGPFAAASMTRSLRDLGLQDVNEEIERITKAVDSDPADAITASRALVETTCKAVLDELAVSFDEHDDLPSLYKKTATALKLDPVQHEVVYRQTLQGLVSAVQGLAELRNKLGDAHGKGRAAVRPEPRHARMAAGAATTVATFLVETLEHRRRMPTTSTDDPG